ncbi:alpha/beta hydrolase [Exilibacterium tricleocarpae]|nr:alpha/beta hydrolase [Exilibacterium tricleocarpae]
MTLRTKTTLTATVLATLLAVFALGPRPVLTGAAEPPPLPAQLRQLETWLAQQENGFGDITAGTEKSIVWHNPNSPGQTDLAILYIHGFSATRQEIAPVPQALGTYLNANVYLTRLPGHGRGFAPMGTATANDWAAETLAAWEVAKKLGRRVIVISTSTGSTLSTWLMQQPGVQTQARAQIYVSPNFGVRKTGAGLLTMPWARQIIPLLLGPESGFEPRSETHAKYWTSRYPVAALSQMQATVDWVAASDVGQIKVPTLFIYSNEDRAVDPARTDRVLADWGGYTERMLIPGRPGASNHVLVGDIVAPQNNESVLARIKEFLANSSRNRQ